jgi:hypothetical protein
MPEAPRKRPENHTVLLTLRGYVKAKPKAVFDVLDGRMRAAGESGSYYTADPASLFIVEQGGWWYRGEYQIVPDEFGSHLQHTIVNVAQRAHRLGKATGRRVLKDAPASFERLVKELRLELE